MAYRDSLVPIERIKGSIMLSSVLKSERAIEVGIAIMRTFVRMRELPASNTELTRKLDALEKKYDEQFRVVFQAVRKILTPPEKPQRPIGFQVREPRLSYAAHGRNKR